MEDMLWKFPHIGKQVFKKLWNKSLAKSKKVSKSWELFITNEKFYKQRVHYETKQKTEGTYGETPLHEAARDGLLSECKLIIGHVEDKNPKNDNGMTPLHWAVWEGHFSICQLIVENVQDKNPANRFDITPLHNAALKGHFKVFQLIFDKVEEKNPKSLVSCCWDLYGHDKFITPFHYAAGKGHFEICKLIIDNIQEVNPSSENGKTPLDGAKKGGHHQIVEYISSAIAKMKQD